jgi:hypothetical protein
MSNSTPLAFVVPDDIGDARHLLDAYLAEKDDLVAGDILEDLASQHVSPLVLRVVTYRMGAHGTAHRSQVEDISSDAMVTFLLHAQAMRGGTLSEPILHFDAFVATLARRACSQYFRRTHPGFYRTRNRVRYLLDKQPDMARWQGESEEWMCGLVEWSSEKNARPLERLSDFDDLARASHPADMLAAIFRRTAAPVLFDDLVAVVARLWNVQDETEELQEKTVFPHTSGQVDVQLGRREWLQSLWEQIITLPRNQRVALLFNLRCEDGGCGVSLLVATGIASLTRIAEAMELSPEDFAVLWHRLPLNDLEIADILKLTRQQVINLRKCARQRLVRRTGYSSEDAW